MRLTCPSLAALALLVATSSFAQGGLKVGTFDPNKLLTGSKLGQVLQEDLNRYRVSKEAEIRKAGEDLEKRVAQYKTSVQTMSPERRDEVEIELGNVRRDLERMTRDADGELTRRRQKAVRDLETEVASILEDYGKRNGYTLIMQRDLCAFASESIDISDELVRLLDARRQK